jgi:O-antigen/teichoic acid export membrane protein
VLACRTHRFSWPNSLSLKSVLTFSSHVIASRLSWYVYSNADFLVAGRVLGQTLLGHYSFSWSLAAVPVEKVTALVGRVTPAFLSAVQSDQAALRRYLLVLTQGLALVTFPATFGLALVADEFVMLALGEKWEPVIIPLRLLAFYASFRAITPLLAQVLFVSGESRFGMWNGIVAAVLLPIGFYVGSSWGSTGIAATWLLLHPLVTLPLYWRVFRTIDLSPLKYLQSLWPALSGSLLMIIAIMLVQSALHDTWSLSIRFAVQVLTGGTVYVSLMFLAYRDRLVAFYRILKSAKASS